jgi:glycosyltransferase involved in cell wall biosynthesis
MRFHILGLPHTVSSKEYVACAYTQKVVKFAKMMTDRGHTVIHYGHEDSDLECTEHVTVTTNQDLEKAYGSYDWRKNFFTFNTGDHAYQTFYANAIREVGLRKQKHDFILPFWGSGTRPVCDAHPDLITVEPGIGYAGGHWANYKIFESYAIMHAYYGMESVGTCKQNFYDIVIPNYFDPDDFTFSKNKQDHFLFLGRVYEGKGIHIAIQVTQAIGAKLVVAGQSNLEACGYTEIPAHVECVGYADVEMRKQVDEPTPRVLLWLHCTTNRLGVCRLNACSRARLPSPQIGALSRRTTSTVSLAIVVVPLKNSVGLLATLIGLIPRPAVIGHCIISPLEKGGPHVRGILPCCAEHTRWPRMV